MVADGPNGEQLMIPCGHGVRRFHHAPVWTFGPKVEDIQARLTNIPPVSGHIWSYLVKLRWSLTAIRILLRVSCRSLCRICAIALSWKFGQDSDVSDILFVSIRTIESIDSQTVDSIMFVPPTMG